MSDNNYPQSGEAHVTYTLREVLDRMDQKLDLLPLLTGEVKALSQSLTDMGVRVTLAEAKIHTLEKNKDQQDGGVMFKDKAWAKLVGLASIMGVVAGITFGVIKLIT